MKLQLLLFITCFNAAAFGQTWEQIDDFPSSARDDGASFTIEGRALCGTGRDAGFNLTGDFALFNASTEQWSNMNPMPAATERQYATTVTHGGYGYLFGGIDSQGGYYSDLWLYVPFNDDWIDLGNAPFEGRSGMQSFVIQDTIYIVGGRTANATAVNEVWAYSITGAQWEQKNDFPGDGIWRGFGSSYLNTGIVGFGADSTNTRRGEVYFYHADTDIWEEITQLYSTPRSYPGTAINGDRLFVFGGETGPSMYSNDFAYINLTDTTWNTLNSFPSTPRRGTMVFTLEDDFYVTTGITDSERLKETWVARNVLSVDYKNVFGTEALAYQKGQELRTTEDLEACFLIDTKGRKIDLPKMSEGVFELPKSLTTGVYICNKVVEDQVRYQKIFLNFN